MSDEIRNCARCGGDHPIERRAFTRPIEDSEGTWREFALCPVNGEPILLAIEPAHVTEAEPGFIAVSGTLSIDPRSRRLTIVTNGKRISVGTLVAAWLQTWDVPRVRIAIRRLPDD